MCTRAPKIRLHCRLQNRQWVLWPIRERRSSVNASRLSILFANRTLKFRTLIFGNFLSHFGQISNRNIGHFVKYNKGKFRVYLAVKTCELFLCFVAIVRVRVYYVDFFVYFVLRHWWVLQVLRPSMGLSLRLQNVIYTETSSERLTVPSKFHRCTDEKIPCNTNSYLSQPVSQQESLYERN